MTGSEVLLYILFALVAAVYGRRLYLQWKIPHVMPRQIADRLASQENLVMLDVRTASERKEQAIEGSIHIPLNELGTRMDELNKHREKEIIVYCRTGNRSLSAAAKLEKRGFKVSNLKGGITEWKFQNLKP